MSKDNIFEQLTSLDRDVVVTTRFMEIYGSAILEMLTTQGAGVLRLAEGVFNIHQDGRQIFANGHLVFESRDTR